MLSVDTSVWLHFSVDQILIKIMKKQMKIVLISHSPLFQTVITVIPFSCNARQYDKLRRTKSGKKICNSVY